MLETRQELAGPAADPWDSWSAASETELLFVVTSGPPACDAVRVSLVETANEVQVGIEVGGKPEQRNPCAAYAMKSPVAVQLSAPLAGRRVVDANL